jgi:hypothetical protein
MWRAVTALIFTVVVIGASVGLFKYMPPANHTSPANHTRVEPNEALQQLCKDIRENKLMGGAYSGRSDPETIKASGCSQAEAAKLRPLY